MEMKRYMAVFLTKLSYSDCKEYVRNGTGVFVGYENEIKAAVDGDSEMSRCPVTRLEYAPDIVVVLFHSRYRRPLARSLLRLFESQLEAHVHKLRSDKEQRRQTRLNLAALGPHRLDEMWHLVQLWFLGILTASFILFCECVASRGIIICLWHFIAQVIASVPQT